MKNRACFAIPLFVLALVALGAAQQQNPAPPPASGGPTGNSGPIVIPRKQPAPSTGPLSAPPAPKKTTPAYRYHVNVPEVRIPVIVETDNGNFIGHLGKNNFRVYENNKLQPITAVNYTDQAPMTVVEMIEYSNAQWWPFLYHILEASYDFTSQLEPHDWVALVTYDLRPHIKVDFTHNKQAVFAGLNSLFYPGFSESDLYDSLSWVIDRLNGIKGQKVIVLISTGINTFSRINFGDIQKKVQSAHNIAIYPVAIGWSIRQYMEENGYIGPMGEMNYIVANNQLRYFAKWTGGRFYEPRFEGAYPDVFHDIAASVRNQYIVTYRPTNTKLDGTYRKIKVEVVGNDGKKLRIVNTKGKKVDYKIIAQSGYRAQVAVR